MENLDVEALNNIGGAKGVSGLNIHAVDDLDNVGAKAKQFDPNSLLELGNGQGAGGLDANAILQGAGNNGQGGHQGGLDIGNLGKELGDILGQPQGQKQGGNPAEIDIGQLAGQQNGHGGQDQLINDLLNEINGNGKGKGKGQGNGVEIIEIKETVIIGGKNATSTKVRFISTAYSNAVLTSGPGY